MLYSGRPDDNHRRKVWVTLSKKVHKGLLRWKAVGKRIITARYNSAFVKLIIIVWYAQTEDAEEENDALYDSLQKTVDETPTHDVLIGDLHAK